MLLPEAQALNNTELNCAIFAIISFFYVLKLSDPFFVENKFSEDRLCDLLSQSIFIRSVVDCNISEVYIHGDIASSPSEIRIFDYFSVRAWHKEFRSSFSYKVSIPLIHWSS